MPGDSGATVVTNARAFYTPRADAGASGARHSPRPPVFGRRKCFRRKLARMRGEIAMVCPGVIARSESDEAIHASLLSYWIASLTLAMMVRRLVFWLFEI
jgi:hypothetical protein